MITGWTPSTIGGVRHWAKPDGVGGRVVVLEPFGGGHLWSVYRYGEPTGYKGQVHWTNGHSLAEAKKEGEGAILYYSKKAPNAMGKMHKNPLRIRSAPDSFGTRGRRGEPVGHNSPPPPGPLYTKGDRVWHNQHGAGTVQIHSPRYSPGKFGGKFSYWVKFDAPGTPFWEDVSFEADELSPQKVTKRGVGGYPSYVKRNPSEAEHLARYGAAVESNAFKRTLGQSTDSGAALLASELRADGVSSRAIDLELARAWARGKAKAQKVLKGKKANPSSRPGARVRPSPAYIKTLNAGNYLVPAYGYVLDTDRSAGVKVKWFTKEGESIDWGWVKPSDIATPKARKT